MDRFDDMRIFVRILERRSFTAAADDLQLPRATVTNALQRLEARLGTRLLERTTRQVAPTLDGAAHYQRCLRLLADMEEAEGAFRSAVPGGLLRVDLQPTLARHFVLPALPDFFQRYPDIALQVGEGDRLVDLVREGVDCVLRAGELQDSSMVARRVALLEQVTVASPAYLARHGEPRTLADLATHKAVDFLSTVSGKPYPFDFTVDGGAQAVGLAAQVSVTGAEMYKGACLAGLGLVQVPRYGVAQHLADGTLKLVLPHMAPRPMPVSVLYPHNRHLSPRVRAFAGWLAEVFAAAA
ncbi:LysR family transcriptional regulator [Massilia atriviolacea]|uniref:LysR family transcriptional regulator n=1 Tax=Massilia atriviolacea TaxID=2495579 RepID=A0A430HGY3_9BURK|nr:LysR family transcriptional regulator [Massilia atriviolacea]RSZ56775.1 LysR family transcriptional regulator [Massilia atriviolacea]